MYCIHITAIFEPRVFEAVRGMQSFLKCFKHQTWYIRCLEIAVMWPYWGWYVNLKCKVSHVVGIDMFSTNSLTSLFNFSFKCKYLIWYILYEYICIFEQCTNFWSWFHFITFYFNKFYCIYCYIEFSHWCRLKNPIKWQFLWNE